MMVIVGILCCKPQAIKYKIYSFAADAQTTNNVFRNNILLAHQSFCLYDSIGKTHVTTFIIVFFPLTLSGFILLLNSSRRSILYTQDSILSM